MSLTPPRRLWVVLLIGGLALGLHVALALAWVPEFTEDSARYWNPSDPLGPFAFWSGRGPGQFTQALFFALPVRGALVVQGIVAGTLWALAAVEVQRHRAGLAPALILVALSVSPWIVFWDNQVLTESVALAAIALATCCAGLVVHGQQSSVIPLLLGSLLCVLSRPQLSPYVLVLLVAVTFLSPARVPKLVIAGVVAVALLGVVEVYWWGQASSVSQAQARNRFVQRADVLGYVDNARDHGMPNCPELVSALARGGTPAQISESISECPKLENWLASGEMSLSDELANPIPILKRIFGPRYWADYAFGEYSGTPAAQRNWGTAIDPVHVRWTNLALLLLVVGTWLWGAATSPRRVRMFVAVASTGALGLAASILLVDGAERWRHILPYLVVLCSVGIAARAVRVAAPTDPTLER